MQVALFPETTMQETCLFRYNASRHVYLKPGNKREKQAMRSIKKAIFENSAVLHLIRWIKHPIVLFVLFLIPLVAITISVTQTDSHTQKALRGYIYGSNIDNRYPLMMSGEWEYYENQFLFPSDFNIKGKAKTGAIPLYLTVPSQTPSAYSFGTYRLTFRVISRSQLFALKTTDIRSSARVYIDGNLIESIGDPSTLTNASLPYNASKFVIFPMDTLKSVHEIIIQYSNYDFYKGGLTSPVYFGTQESIYQLSNQSRLTDSIIVMSVLILAVLLLIIMLLKIPMGNIQHLLLFSLFQGFFILTSGEKILFEQFEEAYYSAFNRISLCLYVMMALFLFLYNREKSMNDRANRVLPPLMCLLAGAVTIGLLFTPQSWQIYMVYALLCYLLLSFSLNILSLFQRMLQINYGALFQTMALICWAGALVISELYQLGHLRSSNRDLFRILLMLGFVVFQLIYVSLRISRVYSANERLAQRMIVSDKVKDDFIEIASHELRTPLHGIINITQSVTRNLEKMEDRSIRKDFEDLDLVVLLAHRMSNIVNDMYSFISASEESHVDLRPLDLTIEVKAVFELYDYVKTQSSVQFINQISSDAATVYADEKKLWQVLVNLVGNAAKYTPSGSIRIRSERRGDFVYVSVIDTGIGMPEDAIDSIFDKSARLTSGMQTASGSGLGLFITRHLVEEMGGRIYVEASEINRGSNITFTLRYCGSEDYLKVKVEEKEVWKHESAPSSTIFSTLLSGNARLLVVDDNADNLTVIEKIFADLNFTIDTAQSGETALALLQENKYDLAVLDIMMPGMTGIEICQEIRKRFTLFELPVLMLTARESLEDVLSAFWAGANDYVIKPADSVELRARVFTLIMLKQSVASAIHSELAFLQAQIKPHFLFNAFNTISAIALTDGVEASHLIDDLGIYLRNNFQNTDYEQLVPLESELELVQAYVNIEKARFGDRLKVDMHVDPIDNLYLPVLTIQPIVENSIRHNLLASAKAIQITLRITQENDFALVVIQDNGQGIEPKNLEYLYKELNKQSDNGHDGGIGLENVNKRLKMHFNSTLTIDSKLGEGTTVLFRIPLKK